MQCSSNHHHHQHQKVSSDIYKVCVNIRGRNKKETMLCVLYAISLGHCAITITRASFSRQEETLQPRPNKKFYSSCRLNVKIISLKPYPNSFELKVPLVPSTYQPTYQMIETALHEIHNVLMESKSNVLVLILSIKITNYYQCLNKKQKIQNCLSCLSTLHERLGNKLLFIPDKLLHQSSDAWICSVFIILNPEIISFLKDPYVLHLS